MKLPEGWTEDGDRDTIRYDSKKDSKARGLIDRVELTCYQDGVYVGLEEKASMVSDDMYCGARIPLAVLELAYKRVLALAQEKNTT